MNPILLVIFGATGDLTAKKLIPAIYKLTIEKKLTNKVIVIGVGRRDFSNEEFQKSLSNAVITSFPNLYKKQVWEKIAENISYEKGLFEDEILYKNLEKRINNLEKKFKRKIPKYFYLATPPENYETILNNISSSGLSSNKNSSTLDKPKLLIEKPFGKDLLTAKHLENVLSTNFVESQIYRIDHYLGKETVQNLLAFRFANGIFEPTWNSQFIDHVQITLSEDIGIGTRGGYYDGVGAMRDMVQNHMLTMMSLVAMDQPVAFDANSIRDARVASMQSIHAIEPVNVQDRVIRAQYTGYKKELNIPAGSNTETYIALKLTVDSPRWRGVPFYLRTGKKLKEKNTQISIHYKKPIVCTGDICLFPEEKVLRNVLTLKIQPNESITLRTMVKEPGYGMNLAQTHMHFTYKDSFPRFSSPEAYQRLLLDVINNDQTLFARSDEVEASWTIVSKILEGWDRYNPPLYSYSEDNFGPLEADKFISRDGRHWYLG